MPKPLPSTYPKHQRWQFVHKAFTNRELVSFSRSLTESSNKLLDPSLPKILKFLNLPTTDIPTLKEDTWLKLWINIMDQAGLGYTIRSRSSHQTTIMATDLAKFVADTGNTSAYYYYWALRFQYPFAFPKHKYYVNHRVAVQPVVLICQYLDRLNQMTRRIQDTRLSKYEIAHFLMKSTGHSEDIIRDNCASILRNRRRSYNYNRQRRIPGFESTAEELFSRGHLFIDKLDFLKFENGAILVSDASGLAMVRTFISYRKPAFQFKQNAQDVRNRFYLAAYCDLDPEPEILFENVRGKLRNPYSSAYGTVRKTRSIIPQITNPGDTTGTFGSGTRKERKFQLKLRRDMILMYHGQCCVCGLDRQEFLIASHIIPVKLDPSIAADRRNCMLLCLLHDRALEKGYMSLRSDYTVIVNRGISYEHPVLVREIARRNGQRIRLPQDNDLRPSVAYLERHRKSYGIK